MANEEQKANADTLVANEVEPQIQAEEPAKSEVLNWEEKYKGLQRTLNKTQKELEFARVNQGIKTDISRLEDRLLSIEEMMALISDRNSEDYDEGKTQKIREQINERRAKSDIDKRWAEYYSNVANDINAIIEDSEIDAQDVRLKPVLEAIKSNDYRLIENVRSQLPRIISKIHKEEATKMKSDIRAMVEKEIKEAVIKGGGFKLDTGSPSGSVAFTREQIANMSEEDYKKNRDRIYEAYATGKISKE